MLKIVLLATAGLLLGAGLGWWLARRGVTAENALEGRPLLVASLVAGAGVVGLVLFFRSRLPLVPTEVALALEWVTLPGTVLLAGLALGLLVLLEWPGREDPERRRRLVYGGGLLLLMLGFILYFMRPVSGAMGETRTAGEVVLQGTPYTCAPASIATLARVLDLESDLSEREVARLAGTTRLGTTALREVRAMRALELEPSYVRDLTADSLLARRQPALLHVEEPIGSRTIRHAVALLEVDPAARTVTLGNPLYGKQTKELKELDGYWTGEAVFVTRGS